MPSRGSVVTTSWDELRDKSQHKKEWAQEINFKEGLNLFLVEDFN
jgi:hypothetical protein